MDNSIDQAKSIVDLMQGMSWFATPIFISLIFPVLYFGWKKLMLSTTGKRPQYPMVEKEEIGISENNAGEESNIEVKEEEKPRAEYFNVAPHKIDNYIFYGCISLFIAGIFILKFGEAHSERIRQNGLKLRKYFEETLVIRNPIDQVGSHTGMNFSELREVVENHPDYFAIHFDSSSVISEKNPQKMDTILSVVDSAFKKNIYTLAGALFETYIRERLESGDSISLQKGVLYNRNNFLQHMFYDEFIYKYLSENRNLYNLSVHGDTVFVSKRNGKAIKGSDSKGKKFQL